MARTNTWARKQRGFGWITLVVYCLVNASMAYWLTRYWGTLANATSESEAERTEVLISGAVVSGVVLILWGVGALVGVLVLFTRGAKVTLEDIPGREPDLAPVRETDLTPATRQRELLNFPTGRGLN